MAAVPCAWHVRTGAGAAPDVVAAWRETLDARAWVATGEEAIAAGWLGDHIADTVRPRIGDVIAAAAGSAAILRRTAEPGESALVGRHSSLTSAEQRVPLLVAYR